MVIDSKTRPIALLGYPVEHSLSPLIHNTAFEKQGLNYIYVALPVAPSDLEAAVRGLRALHFGGSNVTIPHKERVMPLMDELTIQARAVGAVNTIIFQIDEAGTVTLLGDNTDVVGFLEPLLAYAERLEGASMSIWGSGGAARAVAYALLSTFQPESLTIIPRTRERAERLAQDLAPYDERGALNITLPQDAAAAIRSSTIVVNTTPLGMSPDIEGTPWPDADNFSEDQIVYDLVYNPLETHLLKEAKKRRAIPIGGLSMLISQAAASYAEWTGNPMPIDVVESAIRNRFPAPAH